MSSWTILLIACEAFCTINLPAPCPALAGCNKGPCAAAQDTAPNSCNGVAALLQPDVMHELAGITCN